MGGGGGGGGGGRQLYVSNVCTSDRLCSFEEIKHVDNESAASFQCRLARFEGPFPWRWYDSLHLIRSTDSYLTIS